MIRITRGRLPLKVAVILGFLSLGLTAFVGLLPHFSRTGASASGPSPSFSGAPGESNCTACHSTFEVNSGSGSVSIAGIPKNYLPGQQVPVEITVSLSDGVLYGFQMTAVDKNGGKTGTYTLPSPSPVPTLQLATGFVNGVERQYIHHTSAGITPTEFGSKKWQFTWTAPPRRIGKIAFYAAGNAANSDGGTDNDRIYTTSKIALSGSAIANFDGDAASDISLFRPADGIWYSINSDQTGVQNVQFGQNGDIPTPGDYDGDGITDRAVFRPSEGNWYLLMSSGGIVGFPFGLAGDVPVPGDYDGDLKTDAAVYRPSEGVWYVAKSTGGYIISQWGISTDTAAHGDYDGDAKTDFAVYRPSEGVWYILASSDGFIYHQFGLPADRPVQGDYDGDGRHDVAIFRPVNGEWWLLRSSEGIASVQFGLFGDIPAPADFDNDGKWDVTVFRPTVGDWYSIRSGDVGITSLNWGLSGDVPIPNSYLDQ